MCRIHASTPGSCAAAGGAPVGAKGDALRTDAPKSKCWGTAGVCWGEPGPPLRRGHPGDPPLNPWGPEGCEGRAPMVLSLQGLHHVPAAKGAGAWGSKIPGGASWMGPPRLGLGALQGRGGLAQPCPARRRRGAMPVPPRLAVGPGGGVWGCWVGRQGFWGAKHEPKRLFFRGPRRCELSAAAEARCFPAGCARRLLREGLRGLYYYLLSLRGEKKRRNLHCWELCLIGAEISSPPPPGRAGTAPVGTGAVAAPARDGGPGGLPCTHLTGSGSPAG